MCNLWPFYVCFSKLLMAWITLFNWDFFASITGYWGYPVQFYCICCRTKTLDRATPRHAQTVTRDFSSLSLKLLFQNGFLHLVAVFCVFVCLNYLLSLLAFHCLFLWVLKVEHLLLCTVVVTRAHTYMNISWLMLLYCCSISCVVNAAMVRGQWIYFVKCHTRH